MIIWGVGLPASSPTHSCTTLPESCSRFSGTAARIRSGCALLFGGGLAFAASREGALCGILRLQRLRKVIEE